MCLFAHAGDRAGAYTSMGVAVCDKLTHVFAGFDPHGVVPYPFRRRWTLCCGRVCRSDSSEFDEDVERKCRPRYQSHFWRGRYSEVGVENESVPVILSHNCGCTGEQNA